MKKLDKKQLPQFVALCIVSAGVFGYFVVRMVTPSPAAAGTRPQPVAVDKADLIARTDPGVSNTASKSDAAAPAVPASNEAVPPTPGMRDPFVVGYVDPKTIPTTTAAPVPPAANASGLPQLGKPMAWLPTAPFTVPGVSPLPPGFSGFPSPAAKGLVPVASALPPAPAWTVTGVLQSDWEKVAILRNGEARRIVHTGDFVDSVYRVVNVTRTSVTLRHGTAFYQLTLGGVKAAPILGTPTGPPAAPNPAPLPSKPPVSSPLSQAAKSLAKLAQAWFTSAPDATDPEALSHIRATDTAPASLRFLNDEAHTH